MVLDSMDDDSDSKESDFLSFGGDDIDVYLNHYRIPKLNNGINGSNQSTNVRFNNGGKIMSLTELAAQKVACHLPFGQVEHFDPPVPEPMQCRIAFWSFPQDEEDVRLYTCLANGNADVFIQAEDLISLNYVCDMLQVGFHLSANVKFIQDSTNDLDYFRVAITFDRRRITSCSCSCSATTFWCQHAVAVCLQRIRRPQEVTLRAPVSESLQRLEKNQLQKFAQYLINELPQQILPAAQKLLDELLSGDEAVINQNPAAPDPTAGATMNEETSWCLDDSHLSTEIRKILMKQCTTQPTVCSDINALHTTAPPAATEYTQLLRPIRGREPEGLWNLISIVGEMTKRRDSNFFLLLEIMTQEVLRCEKIVTWWFETKVSLHSGSTIHFANSKNSSQSTSQYSCSNICDEIVHLWRLAAMNPCASPVEKKRLYRKFFDWHLEILRLHSTIPDIKILTKRNFLELFPGFKPAMEGCLIDWSDWDEKQGKIIDPIKDVEVEKTKPSKASKKRKKKSKALKQDTNVEPEPSTSSNSEDNHLEVNSESKQLVDEGQAGSILVDENVNVEQELFRQLDAIDIEQQDEVNRQPLNELVANVIIPNANEGLEPDLQVYFMDNAAVDSSNVQKPESLEDYIKVNSRKLADPLETIYAKAEGLYAHGHLGEARKLATRAATQILSLPTYPSYKQLYTLTKRRKKKGSLDNQMSIVASEALSKISFMCNVLLDDPENHHLVFKLVLFGVEMKRSPAATKPLEVKLINQKHDLIMLLKNITLHEEELTVLRQKAQAMCDGLYECTHDALTILMLGNYIFEALVLSKSHCNSSGRQPLDHPRSGSTSSYSQSTNYQLDEHYLLQNDVSLQQGDQSRQTTCSINAIGKSPHDVSLGFYAALHAISVKVNVIETEHPLLCEGTRRQRGKLTLSLLTYYKDDQDKLDIILKHLLDKDSILSSNIQDQATLPISQPAGKKNNLSQDPNQPTEASCHFMFELAKTVFDKAGGNSSTAHLFRPQIVTQNGGRGIHRRLHMCTLRIALYALGLQNRTSINWIQRTYNGRASFIHEQALDIGLPAIKFLKENWEGHLTPVEVASIADKAGCSNDLETKRFAAELAKSCLRFANNLDFNAVRRILAQCKEQSIEMIEEACIEVEQVAESENVCADVLFATARAWCNLYEKLVRDEYGPNEEVANGCCGQLNVSNNTIGAEQDINPCNWQITSLTHQERYQVGFNEPIHPNHWDIYGRTDFPIIPTVYLPTYKHIEYVQAAYRVGMKALDSMKPTLHMGSKHNPKKEDDVLWLLTLSKSLSRECLREFSRSAIKNITNPHVLHLISSDLIEFFATIPYDDVDRNHILLPLIYKCLDRFVKLTRDLMMKHIAYDQKNYVETILDSAKYLTVKACNQEAVDHFRNLLRTIDSRRQKKRHQFIDLKKRSEWVTKLMDNIERCTCPSNPPCLKCRLDIELLTSQHY